MSTYFKHTHTKKIQGPADSKITQQKGSVNYKEDIPSKIPSLIVEKSSLILCLYNGRW